MVADLLVELAVQHHAVVYHGRDAIEHDALGGELAGLCVRKSLSLKGKELRGQDGHNGQHRSRRAENPPHEVFLHLGPGGGWGCRMGFSAGS